MTGSNPLKAKGLEPKICRINDVEARFWGFVPVFGANPSQKTMGGPANAEAARGRSEVF